MHAPTPEKMFIFVMPMEELLSYDANIIIIATNYKIPAGV